MITRRIPFYIALTILIVGALLTGISMIGNTGGRNVRIESAEGTELKARFYEGGESAILICHGFSSDWTNTIRIKDAFLEADYSVLVFDFTGHGSSGGRVGFDNARTDRLSEDVEAAVEFMVKKGFSADEIFLAGHSMGARSILQHSVGNKGYAGLILIGAEVNLNVSRQASFFTGAVDTEMPFVKSLSGSDPASPIIIITSRKDDILTPDSAVLLHAALTAGENAYIRDLIISEEGGFHNYELFDRDIIRTALTWANGISGKDTTQSDSDYVKNDLWIIGLAMIFIAPFLMNLSMSAKSKSKEENKTDRVYPFIFSRVVLWLLALPAGAAVAGLMYLLPLPKPFFSMQFVIILGGYGLVSVVLHGIGKNPGYRTKRNIISEMSEQPVERVFASVAAIVVFTGISLMARVSGFNKVFTGFDYLFWYILFTLLMMIGFYILNSEGNRLSGCSRWEKLVWSFVKYMPFYLFVIFFASLGSVSGLAGIVQGIAFLMYGVYSSKIVKKISGNSLMAALTVALVTAIPFGAVF